MQRHDFQHQSTILCVSPRAISITQRIHKIYCLTTANATFNRIKSRSLCLRYTAEQYFVIISCMCVIRKGEVEVTLQLPPCSGTRSRHLHQLQAELGCVDADQGSRASACCTADAGRMGCIGVAHLVPEEGFHCILIQWRCA